MTHERPGRPSLAHLTFHLVREQVWLAPARSSPYLPEGFENDGFIHCTDGEALVVEVANRYYRDDPGAFLVLEIDLGRVHAPTLYEDAERTYPHIYGPLEQEAVVRTRRLVRAADGAFAGIGGAVP